MCRMDNTTGGDLGHVSHHSVSHGGWYVDSRTALLCHLYTRLCSGIFRLMWMNSYGSFSLFLLSSARGIAGVCRIRNCQSFRLVYENSGFIALASSLQNWWYRVESETNYSYSLFVCLSTNVKSVFYHFVLDWRTPCYYSEFSC